MRRRCFQIQGRGDVQGEATDNTLLPGLCLTDHSGVGRPRLRPALSDSIADSFVESAASASAPGLPRSAFGRRTIRQTEPRSSEPIERRGRTSSARDVVRRLPTGQRRNRGCKHLHGFAAVPSPCRFRSNRGDARRSSVAGHVLALDSGPGARAGRSGLGYRVRLRRSLRRPCAPGGTHHRDRSLAPNDRVGAAPVLFAAQRRVSDRRRN